MSESNQTNEQLLVRIRETIFDDTLVKSIERRMNDKMLFGDVRIKAPWFESDNVTRDVLDILYDWCQENLPISLSINSNRAEMNDFKRRFNTRVRYIVFIVLVPRRGQNDEEYKQLIRRRCVSLLARAIKQHDAYISRITSSFLQEHIQTIPNESASVIQDWVSTKKTKKTITKTLTGGKKTKTKKIEETK